MRGVVGCQILDIFDRRRESEEFEIGVRCESDLAVEVRECC